MALLELHNIVKQYDNYYASNDVSFTIPKGRIFGLLGPNGAGKTTLIRMITRILYPDSGQILFDGQILQDKHTEQIGYMPEERGLYKKMKVGDHLIYLARLKGLDKVKASARVNFWLKKFDIEAWYHKTLDELSKGMSQKVQFIATVIHDPELLILDEPFSGLDPINAKLIEDEISALKQSGKTIIFSTHRMEQVEEICDEIVLVNQGKKILEGTVQELKQRFKENKFKLSFKGDLATPTVDNMKLIHQEVNHWLVQFDAAHQGNQLLRHALDHQVEVISFQEVLPTINEIFIRQVQAN